MKEYTMILTEKELAYIRRAVCDKNMHHCLRGLERKDQGDALGYDIHMRLRATGHNIVNRIDETREYQ